MNEAAKSKKAKKTAQTVSFNEKHNQNIVVALNNPINNCQSTRKGLRKFASSLPDASIQADCGDADEKVDCIDTVIIPKDIQSSPSRPHTSTEPRRWHSETVINRNPILSNRNSSPPYSNFARYLPYLSTPSDQSSSTTSLSSLSVSATNSSAASSVSSFRLPISASQLSLPEPPDGGWGWVVVFAAFMVHMITEGVIVSFGIFLEDLVHEFNESMSATSWVGSFSYGIPALVTPISSVFLGRFGCRITCMVGAVISSIGCIVGCFSTSLFSLIISFGMLSGLGSSLCMTSALVIVSMYFDDRRATATGLSIAGTGVGALVFAPTVEYLITTYTWRGTFLLLSGALLNLAVFGALMRPVETGAERRHRQRLAWLEHFAEKSGLSPVTNTADYMDRDVLGRIKLLRDYLINPRNKPVTTCAHLDDTKKPLLQSTQHYLKTKSNVQHDSNCAHAHHLHNHNVSAEVDRLQTIPESNLSNRPSTENLADITSTPNFNFNYPDMIISQFNTRRSFGSSPSVHNRDLEIDINPEDYHRNRPLTASLKSVTTNHFRQNDEDVTNYRVPLQQISNASSRPNSGHTNGINESSSNSSKIHVVKLPSAEPVRQHQYPLSSSIGPTEKREVLYKGPLLKAFGLTRASLCRSLSLPDFSQVHRIRRRSESDSTSTTSSTQISIARCCFCCCRIISDQSPEVTSVNCCSNFVRRCKIEFGDLDIRLIFRRLCDLRLFGRTNFNLFVLSNFLLYFWYNVTYFFMGVHATDLGISEKRAALLFSILGGANMVGEVVVGLLADREWIDTTMLYVLLVLLCGISTTLVPFFKTFATLGLYAGAFGFGLAANDALCTILLVEFVGLNHLTNSLGICFFCQGVANIIGPPTIGWIIDSTGTQDWAYFISGVGLAIAAFVVVPTICQRLRRQRVRRLRRLKVKSGESEASASPTQIIRHENIQQTATGNLVL